MPILGAARRGRDVTKEEFGARLGELRRAAGLSQKALAQKLGAAQSRIAQWETGVHNPPVTELPNLAAALGVTVADLFPPGPKLRKKK
jgi:transcriptional regulator with XRE-family HTH domain